MDRRTQPASQRGFTILELLISLIIAVEILIGAAIAFDVHNRMARIQTQVTDMQQSLRIAQYDISRLVRMAGRGGLPAGIDPAAVFDPDAPIPDLGGLAIEVRNNVGGTVNADPDRNIARGVAGSPDAVTGTDILIVRGCFSAPLYQIDTTTFDWDPDDNGIADTTTITLPNPSLHGIPQSLASLKEEAGAGALAGWLLMMSPEDRSVYGLGRITASAFSPVAAADPDSVTITLDISGGTPLNPLNTLTGVREFPERMTVALACLLEEYRYYVREVYETPGDATTLMQPRLARARFEPGTETAYRGNNANLALDLAEGIFDLQVAYAFDSDNPSANPAATAGSFDDDLDTVGTDDQIVEGTYAAADRDTDDWLYNDPDDNTGSLAWTAHQFPGNTTNPVDLLAVRVTTLARTARPDPQFQSEDLNGDPTHEVVEDNDYEEAPADVFRAGRHLNYRIRSLATVIEPRNI
jgi:type II secretory pathway pseudopilin PulG